LIFRDSLAGTTAATAREDARPTISCILFIPFIPVNCFARPNACGADGRKSFNKDSPDSPELGGQRDGFPKKEEGASPANRFRFSSCASRASLFDFSGQPRRDNSRHGSRGRSPHLSIDPVYPVHPCELFHAPERHG
jgi:hypothetical protein